MATFNTTLQTFEFTGAIVTTTTCQSSIRDGETLGESPIVRRGLVTPIVAASAGTLREFLARHNASDIGGYRQLIRTTGYSVLNTVVVAHTIGADPEELPIEEFATLSTAMEGMVSSGISATDFDVEAFQDSADGSVVTIRIDVYHRTSGGTETLLATGETSPLTGVMARYTLPFNIVATWGASERMVVKYTSINYGPPV